MELADVASVAMVLRRQLSPTNSDTHSRSIDTGFEDWWRATSAGAAAIAGVSTGHRLEVLVRERLDFQSRWLGLVFLVGHSGLLS